MARLGATRHSASQTIVEELPGIFRVDDFTTEFVGGLDDVLAPVLLTIDNLPSYMDPDVAPIDFVRWLASWFDIEVQAEWSEERMRRTVRKIALLSNRRGTASALAELLEALTESDVALDDGGGVWAAEPGDPLDGRDTGRVEVRAELRPGTTGRLLDSFVPPGRAISWL